MSNIRPFTASDWGAVKEIAELVWGSSAIELLNDFLLPGQYAELDRFVFTLNGIVVGVCGLYRLESHPPHFIGIDWFVVHPKYQNRGIGTELLDHAMAKAAGRLLFVWTDNAAQFYLRRGFSMSPHIIEPTESEWLLIKKL